MIRYHKYFFLLLLFSTVLFAQSLNCAYCGNAIERSYISYQGSIYHESCYKNFVQLRCDDCGKSIDGKFISHKGSYYHEDCYNKSVALKCDLCGGIINGTYTTDYWGNKYHSFHVGVEDRCDYCDRFISAELTRGGVKYNDGRVICNLCKSSAVNNLSKAKTLFNKVRVSLQNIGIKIEHNRIGLELVNKDELKSISFEHGELADPRGFAKYIYYKRGDEITSMEFSVYILKGMPEKDFEAAAAHELMHVWQYENAQENLEPLLAEGSAEYISYMHMKKQYDDYSKFTVYRITNNRDPVYGEGFRKIKRIVEQKGLAFILNHLRKSNRMPAAF